MNNVFKIGFGYMNLKKRIIFLIMTLYLTDKLIILKLGIFILNINPKSSLICVLLTRTESIFNFKTK